MDNNLHIETLLANTPSVDGGGIAPVTGAIYQTSSFINNGKTPYSYTRCDNPPRSALEEKQPDVVWLFNNAGFGKLGDYGEIDPRDHYDIANLNCAALSAVTGTVLPYMHAGAHIVNVCSIAAFAPTPRMTVYCSTKAFVYSFSKALRAELRKKQIGVTAVCPGPMDTEFLPVAGIQGNSKMFNTLPRCNVAEVAEKTVKAARRNRGIYTNKLIYKLYRVLAKLLPHGLIVRFSEC